MPIKTRFGALVAVVLFAAASLPAGGQSGTCSGAGCPDSSFGANGIVRLPSFGGAIGAIAVQDFGGEQRIVALNTSTGVWKLTRYRFTPDKTNVAVDTSFGVSGSVTKSASGYEFTASGGIAVQSDNKLVVVGTKRSSKRGAPSVLTVVRYTPDGLEDATFGPGGTVSLPGWSASWGGFHLQPDGMVVLAVLPDKYTANTTHVIRLDPWGQLDNYFGDGGVVAINGTGLVDCLTVQEVEDGSGIVENKIILGTNVYRPESEATFTAALVRLNADGSLDSSFASGNGKIETPLPGAEDTTFNDVAIDPSGRIVVAGHAFYRVSDQTVSYSVLAARFTEGGTRDVNFASNGLFLVSSPQAEIQDLAIAPDDTIILVGYPRQEGRFQRGLVAWRLLESGAPDPSFGTDGLVSTIVTDDFLNTIWPENNSARPDIAFLSNGSLLLGGGALVQLGKRTYNPVAALGRFVY
jgi:uncharacterized delta-60 repeat protein